MNKLRLFISALTVSMLAIGSIATAATASSAAAGHTSTSVTSSLTAKKSTAKSSTMAATFNLNVRAGAGTNHKVVGSIKKNQKVAVVSVSKGWAKLSNGKYASAKYLKNAAPAKAAPSKKAPAKTSGKYTAGVKTAKQQQGFNYAQSVAKSYGSTVTVNPNACGGLKNLLGCYESSNPNNVVVTPRLLDRSNAWIKATTLHEISHRAIHKTCGTPVPSIVGGRIENVTNAYAATLGAVKMSSSFAYNGNDAAIAKKIKAGNCK